jgi:electron transfer flavoprotein alpha subunit
MILVFIEEREQKIKKASLECLSEAKRLAQELNTGVEAVLTGNSLEPLAKDVLPYGPSKVYLLEHTLLEKYSASGFSSALSSLVEEINPDIILMAATAMGKDLAPRLAARLGVGMATECTETRIQNGKLEVVRPIFAGKAFATFTFTSSPQIATLRPNVFPLIDTETGGGSIVKKEVVLDENMVKAPVDEILREEGAALDITEADIIVSGGRGMKGPENFDLLKELAALLPHAAVGASRSAVDSEWIDHQHQVGQTGKTVSPNLYIAMGISGAIQHVAGMSSSKFIVAVNKDPEAPIFKIADFGVVGDLFQIIPLLKDELKKVKTD